MIAKITYSLILTLAIVFSAFSEDAGLEKLAHAKQLETHGVWMEAAIEYEEYLRQNPGDTNTRIVLIDLLLRLNRFD